MRHLVAFFSIVLLLTGCQSVPVTTGGNGVIIDIERTTNLSAKIKAIGGLPKSVYVEDVSRDGLVAIGKFRSSEPPYDWQTFLYRHGQGIATFGAMANGYISNGEVQTLRLNGTGSVIWGTFTVAGGGSHIFSHSRNEKVKDLGNFGKKSLRVNGVSNDGSVVVGHYWHSSNEHGRPLYHAFRFSALQGFQDIGTFGGESGFARGVSANGQVIAGNIQLPDTSAHALIHTPIDGNNDLGAIGGVAAFATDIIDDGTLAVGNYYGASSFFRYTYDFHLFLYTKAAGVQSFGAMGGTSVGTPRLSTDGKRITGSYRDGDDSFLYIGIIRLSQPIGGSSGTQPIAPEGRFAGKPASRP